MGLKLRTSYIVLAISIVILAVGITLIVIDSTPDRTTETPGITMLVPETLVVPVGTPQRLYFDISRSGTLKGIIGVTGGSIYYNLYKEPREQILWEQGRVEQEGRSNFEVPLDTGRYYLEFVAAIASAPHEERTVSVCLEFEG